MSNQLDATIAKRLDITVKQNQTFNAVLTFVDAASAPIDLTGATVKLSVRQADGCGGGCMEHAYDGFNIVYKQDFEPTITGAGMNVLQFNEVVLLSEGLYKYDLLVQHASGQQFYYLTGSFRVKRSYTLI